MTIRFRDTNYFVTTEGDVIRNKKKLKGYKKPDGYIDHCIQINKKRKHFLLHRMIAETFIPNPENKPQVNHINGVKDDNRIENLEWVTPSENMIHAFDNGLNKAGTKIESSIIENIINEYIPYDKKYGQKKLAEKYNIDQSTISLIINKKRRMKW